LSRCVGWATNSICVRVDWDLVGGIELLFNVVAGVRTAGDGVIFDLALLEWKVVAGVVGCFGVRN
jgi:hypothetical protein